MPIKHLPNTEFKTFPFELKSFDEDQGLITGYLSTFGNIDLGNDRVVKNAFKKTIAEAKSRMQTQGRKYLWAFLWMHNPEQPIGGYIDAQEDDHGLLVTAQLDISTNEKGIPNNPLATMVFSGFKSGYIDEQSIGFNVIQKDYEQSVRNLKEIRMIEGSAITMNFAMNPQALVPASGVKAASGSTSFPLASRTTAWSKSKAIRDIESATDGDWSKAAKYFFWSAPDPSKEADFKLPFVAQVDGEMKAIPQGIIAAAASLQGARGGVSLPDGDVAGVKAKIAHYYSAMDMTPPWEQDKDKDTDTTTTEKDTEKRTNRTMQKKDFNDRYRQQRINDWLYNDWYGLVAALQQSLQDAFASGDTPEGDLTALVLNDSAENRIGFISALRMYVQEGIDLDYANYLQEQSPVASYPFGWMSRPQDYDAKSGARFSQASKDELGQHAEHMKAIAANLMEQHKAMIADHTKMVADQCKAITNVAEDLSATIGRQAYDGDDADGQQSAAATGKSRFTASTHPMRREPAPLLTRTGYQPSHRDTGQTTSDDDEPTWEALEAALLSDAL